VKGKRERRAGKGAKVHDEEPYPSRANKEFESAATKVRHLEMSSITPDSSLQKVANRRSIETKLAAAEGGDKRKGGGDQLWKGDGEAEQMGDFSLHLGTFVKRKPRKDHGYTDEGENLLTGGELAVGEFSGDEKGVSKTRIATQSPWLRDARHGFLSFQELSASKIDKLTKGNDLEEKSGGEEVILVIN
jgi:hypothetical protein